MLTINILLRLFLSLVVVWGVYSLHTGEKIQKNEPLYICVTELLKELRG